MKILSWAVGDFPPEPLVRHVAARLLGGGARGSCGQRPLQAMEPHMVRVGGQLDRRGDNLRDGLGLGNGADGRVDWRLDGEHRGRQSMGGELWRMVRTPGLGASHWRPNCRGPRVRPFARGRHAEPDVRRQGREIRLRGLRIGRSSGGGQKGVKGSQKRS